MTSRRLGSGCALGVAWIAVAVVATLGCGEPPTASDQPDVSSQQPADTGQTPDASTRSQACNGHVELCDRRVDEVAFAGTHNSMSSAEDGFLPPNHKFGLRRQLDDGIRAMLLDTHYHQDDAHPGVKTWLCHSLCALGATPLATGLKTLHTFLVQHPREVVVLLFQDGIEPVDLADAMTQSGLAALRYEPPYTSKWPTLRALIDSNQRVIVTTESRGPPPAWHRRFWDLGWDTPYAFNGLDALLIDEGPADSCRLNRGSTKGSLFLLNHWVSTPIGLSDPAAAPIANSMQVLLKRAKRCQAKYAHLPNIVAVDHHHEGDVVGVVRALNGL